MIRVAQSRLCEEHRLVFFFKSQRLCKRDCDLSGSMTLNVSFLQRDLYLSQKNDENDRCESVTIR